MGIFNQSPQRNEKGQFTAAPYREARPLTAAAMRVNIGDKNEVDALAKRRVSDDWQESAYEYYDLIGEVKQAATIVANVTSRIRLYVGYVTDDDVAPSNIQDMDSEVVPDELKKASAKALSILGTGNGGIPGLLQDAALNLFVTGECYLVQQPARPGSHQADQWQIRSVDEIVAINGRNPVVKLKTRRDAQDKDLIELPKHAFCGRIWRMHPRFSDEADSSMRGNLELCEELLLLNKAFRKDPKVRMNAGLLLLPDDLSASYGDDGEYNDDTETIADPSDSESTEFEEELMTAMTTPIADEGSVNAVVPLIVRGPAESLEKVRHISIERPYDAQSVARAERVLERILVSLDVPIDILKGLASVKYSNAIQIEDQLYKAHIEPLALLIADSLTVVFLRPVLKGLGFTEEEISRVVIWYDPSAITSRPSKAEAADRGFEMKTINAQAWRRAHGFSETDAPTELEIGQRLALDRGLLNEQVTEALLRTLIPTILEEVRSEQLEQNPDAAEVQEILNGDTIPQPTDSAPEADSGPRPPSGLIEP